MHANTRWANLAPLYHASRIMSHLLHLTNVSGKSSNRSMEPVMPRASFFQPIVLEGNTQASIFSVHLTLCTNMSTPCEGQPGSEWPKPQSGLPHCYTRFSSVVRLSYLAPHATAHSILKRLAFARPISCCRGLKKYQGKLPKAYVRFGTVGDKSQALTEDLKAR
jgi:hypothetical protein